MKSVIACLIFVGATAFAPAYAQTSGDDPLAALAQELNLTQTQKQQRSD